MKAHVRTLGVVALVAALALLAGMTTSASAQHGMMQNSKAMMGSNGMMGSHSMMNQNGMTVNSQMMDSTAQQCGRIAGHMDDMMHQHGAMDHAGMTSMRNMGMSMQVMAQNMGTMMGDLIAMQKDDKITQDSVLAQQLMQMRNQMNHMAVMMNQTVQDMDQMSNRMAQQQDQHANSK